jgi:perosamine synthetase
MIPVCVPWMPGNEIKYATEALRDGWISGEGKFIKQFEDLFSKYTGMEYGVSCSSGSTALHMACAALNIKRGDEVLVTNFTNIASINAIILSGAKPVLIDVEKDTWNMDPAKIEEKVTPKTKAIMPVHIYGHPCDMDIIEDIAQRHRLYVIEDVAEAHGAEYRGKKAGSFGDISCFSFYANKILTTGEGGMCLTNNDLLADRLSRLRNMYFGNPRYVHEEVGFNYRMTNVTAAIGLAQTENVDMLVKARRDMGLRYNALLKDIKGLILPVEKRYAKNVYWMYGIVLDKSVKISRNELIKKLEEKGIGVRSFFMPMNLQPAFVNKTIENAPDCEGDFSVGNWLWDRGLYIPSSSNITLEEQKYVADTLKQILK